MPACLSCGAQLPPDAARCPLCGTPAGAADPDAVETLDQVDPEPTEATDRTGVRPSGECPACGHTNPPGARFCNACGAALPTSDAATEPTPVPLPPQGVPVGAVPSPPAAARPPSAPGRRALALVAGGVVAVGLLYGVTVWSGRQAPAADPALEPAADPAVGAAAAIPDGPAPPLSDTLQAAADRQAALGTPGGYYESGRYYLTAAFEATATNPTASAQWARRAREEFERSLSAREDPDVRLALAEALRFDPAAPPMQPIAEVQRVLAVAPNHAGAHYLLGDLRLMRAQFQPEWADSARVSFERVVAVAPPGSELRARAEQALAALAAPPAAAPPAAGPGG